MKKLMASAALIVLASGTIARSEPAALQFGSDWAQDLSFLAFLPTSSTGTSTLAGQSADIDMNLREALDVLDFGASARYEAWRGDFGFIVDGNYLGLSDDTTLPGPLGADVSVDVAQWWLGALGAYRVASGTSGANGLRYSFDVQFGARYNSLKQEVRIAGPGPGLNLGGTETWWEPVIGARYFWQADPRWTLGAQVDAGGFGVGGSDLQWSATLGADYTLGDSSALKFGLRYYSIDFETERSDGTFAYDVDQVGPFVGYTFRF